MSYNKKMAELLLSKKVLSKINREKLSNHKVKCSNLTNQRTITAVT